MLELFESASFRRVTLLFRRSVLLLRLREMSRHL